MLRAVKSYLAFANSRYRLVMLVLIPLLLVVVNVLGGSGENGVVVESLMLLCVVDVLSDFFFMRGFYIKKNDTLEFMKASPRFRKTMKEVVVVDAVRRVVMYQIPVVVVLLCSIGDEESMEWCTSLSAIPWMEAFTAQLAVLLIRHLYIWVYAYISIICVHAMQFLAMAYAVFAVRELGWWVDFVSIILWFATMVATVWYTDKKMKESYYD